MASTAGVDVGGTFTDVVYFENGVLTGHKIPTSHPQDRNVVVGLADVSPEAGFLHGTTVATNQLLEEDGATVALITSEGFEDVLEIARQARPSLYDQFEDRPTSLVDRTRRIGIRDVEPSSVSGLETTDAEAIAVALVRSYEDPSDELRVAAHLRESLEIPVSVGAEVSPSFREYERVATTVIDAYLTPTVASYLRSLDEALPMTSKMVMTSSGGLLPFGVASGSAGRLVLSGPAGGVVAAAQLGAARGHNSVISFDMGGTSTDVCRIESAMPAVGAHTVAGRVNRVPSLPIKTIGAGGGSVAWPDEGGALRVGPRSAGAEPGPACYGQGGAEATVTDANVLLGSIPSHLKLGGTVALDVAAATSAVGRLGSDLGLSGDEAASGIVAVVDNHMEQALRAVSVQDGVDPRESVLVAFGGAGGLHASRLARALGMGTVLVPPLSGVFSALGLLMARPRLDRSRTVLLDEGSPGLAEAMASLETEARLDYSRSHGDFVDEVEVSADVRYRGQSHELSVAASGDWAVLRQRFEESHRDRFGFARAGVAVELVDLKVEVVGRAPMVWTDLPPRVVSGDPTPQTGEMMVEGRRVEAEIWSRPELPGGFECTGPAVLVEADSAIRLEPDDVAFVHADGTVELSL